MTTEPTPASATAASSVAAIEQAAHTIVEAAIEQFYALRPDLRQRHGPRGIAVCREDCFYHIEFLAAAIRNGSVDSFVQYICWVDIVLRAHAGGSHGLGQMLELLGQGIRRSAGEAAWTAAQPTLDAALAALQGQVEGHGLYAMPPTSALARSYLRAILQGNRLLAQQLILDAVREGMPLRQVYLEVFQPALYEVGQLWETGQISVAQEHLATAITQTILAALYAQTPLAPGRGQRAIVACLSGNHHEIGARMAADFLQWAGFDTLYLGANTPEASFLAMVDDFKPHVVGLPSSLPRHIEGVRAVIEQIHADFRRDRPTILVGGLAFNLVDGLWRQVNADVWGHNAGEAVDRLVGAAA